MHRYINTDILPTHTPVLFQAAVRAAAAALRAGDVVALPTETVYGLAANALDAEAVSKIFTVKGRPPHNPVIVHVASLAGARRCAARWPAVAVRLAKAFWPGPLTLVLPKAGIIPDIVTANGPTVGVRWPAHPLIQAVIRACGFPLAAPSANLSNHISPTTAEHVGRQLGGRVRLIVDGGASPVGIESTVLDLTAERASVLRPGMIRAETLAAVIGETRNSQCGTGNTASALRSPGLLRKHYAPRAKVAVLHWRNAAELNAQMAGLKIRPAKAHVMAHRHIPPAAGFANVSLMPRTAEAFARALYAEWHRCDEAGAEWIIMESLPETPAWSGIADRVRRAAT